MGKRAAKRKRSYKEVESDIDEDDAEKEGREETEMTKIIKLRQKLNREKRCKISHATQIDLPDIPVPGSRTTFSLVIINNYVFARVRAI